MKGKKITNVDRRKLRQFAIKTLIEGAGKANLDKLPGFQKEAIFRIENAITAYIAVCQNWDDGIDKKWIKENNEILNDINEIIWDRK